MKKTIKTYSRRTLSIIMSLLMLMTAWVFVAPELLPEADAVTAGSYYYRFYAVTSDGGDGANFKWNITGNEVNGTSTSGSMHDEVNKVLSSNNTTYEIFSGTSSKFPRTITGRYNNKAVANRTMTAQVYLEVGRDSDHKQSISVSASVRKISNDSSWYASGSASASGNTISFDCRYQTWEYTITVGDQPYANEFTFTQQPSNISLKEYSASDTYSATDSKTTTVKYWAKDQYGVLMGTTYTPTVKYAVGDSTNPGSTDSTYLTASQTATAASENTTTITAKSGFRKNVTSNYYATAQLSVTVAGSSDKTFKSNTFKIYNPKFTYTYNRNDGTDIPTNGTITPTSYKFYYGRTVTQQKTIDGKDSTKQLYPQNPTATEIQNGAAITQKRAGFDFQGMYASAYIQYGVSWAEPSGALKLQDSTSVFPTPATSSSNDATTNANKTWYAAWLAKNVHVTYVNNDGTVIKESDYGKYNQKASYSVSGIPSGQNNAIKPANPTFQYAPGVSHGTYDYDFKGWTVVSAKQYSLKSDGSQEQIDYSDLVGSSYDTAVLLGDTVFQAVYEIHGSTPNKYTITYKNGAETTSNSNLTYLQNGYKTVTIPAATADNNMYTYEFLGWAVQVNSTDTVYWQDWDEDAGAYVPLNSAQTPMTQANSIVYSDATWVAVYGRKYIDYQVTFNFVGVGSDETGATTYDATYSEVVTKHYDELIEIPAPQGYTGGKLGATNPQGYANSVGYTYAFNAWSPVLSGTEVAVNALSGWTTSTSNPNLKTKSYKATYTGTPAHYTIEFVAPDTVEGADGKQYAQFEDGALKTKVLNEGNTGFDHGTSVAAAKTTADNNVVRSYRDDDNEYTFTNWSPAYSTTAIDNVTYTAQYDVTPLYTVTYADENGELGSWKGTTSEYIPLTVDGMDTPTKEDDLYATDYTFSGWAETEYDAKNPVNPAINLDGTRKMLMPENGTTVYAQFTRTPIIYTINFIYGDPVDGVMPDHKQELEYGMDVVIPNDAAVARSNDNTYHYDFSGWDRVPSATVTGDATYTANYRKSYVYYDVTWLYQNGEKEGGKDFRVEKYIYGERIRAPYSTPEIRTTDRTEDPLLPELGENCTYAFDQWVLAKKVDGQWVPQLDEDNQLIPFNASTYIEAGVEYGYLPTYKSVADMRTLVILDEDGTELGRMQIGFGEKILDYVSTPEAKNPDDTNHYVFDKWINVATNVEVTATTTMAGDTTIQAVYRSEAHSYEFFETKTAPTFDAPGVVTLVCEAEGCGHTHDVTLPVLKDNVLPDIRLYVKNTHWDSTVPPALTALDDTVIPIAPNSLLIANGADSAEASVYYINKSTLAVKTALASGDVAADYVEVTYNAAGTGSQVTEIWAYYSSAGEPFTLEGLATVPNSSEGNPDGWHQIYARSGDEEANHSDTFASFEPAIEDGNQYVVYLKAIDAKGNENFISSKKLGYDTTAPEITLTTVAGGNGAKTKFCLDATIVLDEANLTVTLDGNPITMTEGETEGTFEYKDTPVGKHTVRVVDPAGNVTLRAFEIIGAHNTVETYKAATCTEAGWKKDVCTLCGNAIGDVTVYEASGHEYQIKTKRATCTEAGYTQEICSKCGDAKPQVPTPALGHTWNDGKITKAPNCTQNGIMVYTCTRCGINDIIEGDELDVTLAGYDADNAAAILEKHPDLAVTTDVESTDPETGDPITTKVPVQATDAFGNPAYVQKTDPDTGAPLFTTTVATVDGKTVYNSDNSVAYLPDYDTTQPIYKYVIVHDYNNHNFKVEKQTIAPTCTEAGVVTHECRYCGLKFYVRDVDALGHDFTADEAVESAWIVGLAPTCDTAGYKYPAKCARCDAANSEKVNQVVLPATGHHYVEDESAYVAPAKDSEDHWIMHEVFIGEYYIDDLGNIINDEHKIGEDKSVYGYRTYVCENNPKHIKVVEVDPEIEYTYTFICDGVTLGTLTKQPGDQITAEELPTATRTDTPSTRYTFKEWLYQGTTDAAAFPMIITTETGDKTFVASFKEETIYYTITFYEEDGTTEFVVSGFKTYEQEFTQVGPEKATDDTYVYTFKGWVPLDDETATPITTITVLGDASYKAVYEATLRTYTVAWVVDGSVVKTETAVSAGSVLGTGILEYPADPSKDYDEGYHYTFTGWAPAAGATVTSNTRVVAQFNRVTHHFVLSPADDRPASCTQPARKTYRCDACDCTYEVTTGNALGHDFDNDHPIEYVAPTPDADGHKIVKCTRCDEIVTIPLTYYAIRLKITVKNTAGAAVAGAKVSVYDGDLFIDSDITGTDGVAVIYVPEAKTYRIVIEGAEFSTVSGEITVNELGRITGGAIPTPKAVQTCTCTCHKSGIWPTIFRFFHRFIKLMTGKYHCCADANY